MTMTKDANMSAEDESMFSDEELFDNGRKNNLFHYYEVFLDRLPILNFQQIILTVISKLKIVCNITSLT